MTDQKAEGGQGPEAEASARLRSQQGRALPSSGFAPELEPMQDALQERSRGSWPLRRITCAEELRNRRCVPRWPANYTQQPTSRARAGGKEATCTRLAAERGDVGRTGMAEVAQRKPILVVLAFNAALLLALLSALLSITDYVPDVERSGLLWACGFATSSVGLACCSLPRMPRGLRCLAAAVMGLAALAGLYSTSRLLG